jgi:hopene-associated glycosyltransferase HpnB
MLTFTRNAAWLAAVAWIGLVVARGQFWDAASDRLADPVEGDATPDVHVIIPARNEADVIGRTVSSILAQRYAGRLTVTVVDDRSDDATASEVAAAGSRSTSNAKLSLRRARVRPDGWSGKVWAMSEGIAAARADGAKPVFWWFTDADVEHADDTLARLVTTARVEQRDLVSLMVELHCAEPWEQLLIPAFVFFFRMLYPFAWVNDNANATAGAAGGCILIRDDVLQRIGGIERISGELIDDCSLAAAVANQGGTLWLGLTSRSRSVRPYIGLDPIWSMVARTAYTQLKYSPLVLAGTVAGMALLYVSPVAALAIGVAKKRPSLALPGLIAFGVMSAAYAPTVRLYRQPWWRALTLPLAGLLYTAMTVDSGLRHWRGQGGTWKGRHFTPDAPVPGAPEATGNSSGNGTSGETSHATDR